MEKMNYKLLNQLRAISTQDRYDDVQRVHSDIIKFIEEASSESYQRGMFMGALFATIGVVIGYTITSLM